MMSKTKQTINVKSNRTNAFRYITNFNKIIRVLSTIWEKLAKTATIKKTTKASILVSNTISRLIYLY